MDFIKSVREPRKEKTWINYVLTEVEMSNIHLNYFRTQVKTEKYGNYIHHCLMDKFVLYGMSVCHVYIG